MIFLQVCLSAPLLVPVQEPPAEPAPAQAPEAEVSELIYVDYRGVDAFFASEKDARLHAALRMIDDRLREIPGEAAGQEMPEGAFPVLRRMIEGPLSLRIFSQDKAIAGMMLPLFGELRLEEETPGGAEALALGTADVLNALGLQIEVPVAGALGVIPAPLPLWMGSLDADYVLRFGKEGELGAPGAAKHMPEGVTPALYGRMDYGAGLDLLQRVAVMSGDTGGMDEMEAMLEQFGMNELAFEYGFGFDDQRAYEILASEGYGQMMTAMHMKPAGPLSSERIAWIPEDASWAVASRIDLSGYLEFLNGWIQEMPDSGGIDVLEMIAAQTGVDVQAEVLDTIGQHFLIYGSDSTGGGGLTSTVMVMELSAPDQFRAFMGRMTEMIGGMAAAETEGYVQLRGWKDGELEFTSVQTPGIPIPMEPTFAIVGDAAVFAMTPQAAVAAARQITSGTRSLLDQRALMDQLPTDMNNALSLVYIDTARFIGDGYGVTSMLCSGLANGVRSRDGERDPGMILPAYTDLARGAKSFVGVSRLEGDTLVAEYRFDRSHLVNMAGMIGWFAEVPGPLVALGVVGAAAAAREEAHSQEIYFDDFDDFEVIEEEVVLAEDPQDEQAWADIENLTAALEMYAASNDGRYPATLAELAERDANGNQFIESVPNDPWGQPYKYVAPTEAGDVPLLWYEHE